MVTSFVEEFAKLLALEPEKIKIELVPYEDYQEIVIYAKKVDVGRIIGKDGTMVKAIKTIIGGCKVKENVNYKITVKHYEQ